MLKTQSQLLEVLERFSTPHLQVVCDPYNYLSSHLVAAQDRATSELLARFEDRFVVAHLKDVDPGGVEVASPAFGTGVFNQQPYLEFLRDRRPDLPLVLEHLALDEIPQAIPRVGGRRRAAVTRHRRTRRGRASDVRSWVGSSTRCRRTRTCSVPLHRRSEAEG